MYLFQIVGVQGSVADLSALCFGQGVYWIWWKIGCEYILDIILCIYIIPKGQIFNDDG